jgi:serine/threonine protein kinase
MMPTPPAFSDTDLDAAFREYKILLPELGYGSYKAAYRIQRNGLDAVLKVVKEPATLVPGTDETALPPRFEREITAMRKVKSRRIVRVLEGPELRRIGRQQHVWYIEPFYGGGTLEDRIKRSPVSASDGIELVDAILEGIEALWDQAHLVHRDIKPSNIVFGDDGPVLLDLGIALHADLSPLTNAFGFSPRTPRYAAPEQFDIRRVAPIDSRTDQFLCGLVAFEAMSGAHPFMAGPANEYLDRLRNGRVDEAAIATIGDPCTKLVIRRLLRPNPHERYRSAAMARGAIQGCQP